MHGRLNDLPEEAKRLFLWSARLAFALSAVLCVAVVVVYAYRADACAAATVFPIWVWVLAGLAFVAFARREVGRRWCVFAALAWCAVMLAFADHPTSILRFSGDVEPKTLRIVSLNCASSRRALREVAVLHPDIVLVQESPGRESLAALAQEMFGAEGQVIWGPDASIIARGRLTPMAMPRSVAGNAAHARLELANGLEIEIVSLRLEPALVRVDLWSPDCWREQAANRRRRRSQLQAIVGALAASSSKTPLIVGGDFNAPPGDAVFRSLKPRWHDAFSDAGRGWGNTIINSAPFLRIDQIWLSPQWKAVDVFSRATEHSDHRMVVCDVVLSRYNN